MLVIQSGTMMVGLYLVIKTRFQPRVAALIACGIFLFPPISGVTGLVTKDALMAGSLLIATGLLVDERSSPQRLALVFMLLATLMRWNAFSATFAPMVLMFR